MRSLTISMPALTVFESNYTRKKQVRLFACIQGVKKVPDPKQNYIGLMTEG